MSDSGTRPLVISPDAGQSASPARVIKLLAHQTGGAAGCVVSTMPAGLLIPPHQHERESEIGYTLTGKLTWLVDGGEVEAPAGTTVWRPAGSSHAVWTSGREPATFLEVMIPGGWESVLLDLDRQLASGTFHLEGFIAHAATYGVRFDIAAGRRIAAQRGVRMIGDPPRR